MPQEKGLDRGGTLGQEGELSPDGGSQAERVGPGRERGGRRDDKSDKSKPLGGTEREPSLEEKQRIQPTRPPVD